MDKPFSQACERNSEPILKILVQYLTKGRLLEVGSGTGQHAVFMAPHFPDITWVCSDVVENHPGIKAWLNEAKLKNIEGPKALKVGVDDFPDKKPYQYVFTANTLHIMSWKEVKTLFKLLGKRLREGSLVFLYGPFNYNGEYTSEGNRDFDQWLKERHSSASAIRNFEDVEKSMQKNGFKLLMDHQMPANNRILVFERLAFH
jgi:cyclopropane fatty-acyl-phospholipid synthase-like methyltransferase